jgi:hypothetical protein
MVRLNRSTLPLVWGRYGLVFRCLIWPKTAGHLDARDESSVGARCVTIRRIGFADRPITSEITHLDPPRTWGIKGVDGPIRARVDVMVEPLADSASRLTIDHHRLRRARHRTNPHPPRRRARSPQRDAREPREATTAAPVSRLIVLKPSSLCTRRWRSEGAGNTYAMGS